MLHGTLAPFTVEEEEGILDILCPLLYPDMARDELVMISQRDGTVYDDATWTVERLYAKADWQVEDPAYITFSDGTIYAKNQQFPPYEAVTMASTAAIDPQLFTRVMGDLPFASKAEIGETGASLLKAVGIRTEETPALTIVYSGDQALISAGRRCPTGNSSWTTAWTGWPPTGSRFTTTAQTCTSCTLAKFWRAFPPA